MKGFKRTLGAVSVLAVAIAVLAGPASASAAVWLHNGAPFSESREQSLRGGEVVQVPAGAFLCNAEATLTTAGGSTAQITAYNVELASCSGLLGEFNGCEVTAASVENLPWNVTVNTVDLTAGKVGITYSFDEGCPIHKVAAGFPEVLLPLEAPEAIRNFNFSQEGVGRVDGEEGWLIDSGVLQLPEEEFGTYGIG